MPRFAGTKRTERMRQRRTAMTAREAMGENTPPAAAPAAGGMTAREAMGVEPPVASPAAGGMTARGAMGMDEPAAAPPQRTAQEAAADIRASGQNIVSSYVNGDTYAFGSVPDPMRAKDYMGGNVEPTQSQIARHDRVSVDGNEMPRERAISMGYFPSGEAPPAPKLTSREVMESQPAGAPAARPATAPPTMTSREVMGQTAPSREPEMSSLQIMREYGIKPSEKSKLEAARRDVRERGERREQREAATAIKTAEAQGKQERFLTDPETGERFLIKGNVVQQVRKSEDEGTAHMEMYGDALRAMPEDPVSGTNLVDQYIAENYTEGKLTGTAQPAMERWIDLMNERRQKAERKDYFSRAEGSEKPAALEAAPQLVTIQAPDGSTRQVPVGSAQKYIEKGGKLVS